jgi:hypothetical protein
VRVVQRGSVAATLRLGCMAGDRVGTLTATTLLQAESVEAAALRDAVAAMVASAAEGDTPVDADDVSIVSAERVVAADGACGVRVRFSVAVTTTGGAAMWRRSHRLRSLLATAPTNDAAQVAAVAARRLLQVRFCRYRVSPAGSDLKYRGARRVRVQVHCVPLLLILNFIVKKKVALN